MQQIINFILRYKNFILYIFLMIISLGLGFTIQSHSYHQSSFFNSSSWIAGNIYETSYGITSYFDLNKENKNLVEENKRLRLLLFNKKEPFTSELDSTQMTYTVTYGQVIKKTSPSIKVKKIV